MELILPGSIGLFCWTESVCRMILLDRISLRNGSAGQNQSAEWFCLTEFRVAIFLGRIRAEWFCLTESLCRMILLDRISLQNILSRIILLCRLNQQNHSADSICTAEWFCWAESFCRMILSSRTILLSFSPAE